MYRWSYTNLVADHKDVYYITSAIACITTNVIAETGNIIEKRVHLQFHLSSNSFEVYDFACGNTDRLYTSYSA